MYAAVARGAAVCNRWLCLLSANAGAGPLLRCKEDSSCESFPYLCVPFPPGGMEVLLSPRASMCLGIPCGSSAGDKQFSCFQGATQDLGCSIGVRVLTPPTNTKESKPWLAGSVQSPAFCFQQQPSSCLQAGQEGLFGFFSPRNSCFMSIYPQSNSPFLCVSSTWYSGVQCL